MNLSVTRKLTPEEVEKINSLTKYPSILTYHGLGQKGNLTEEILVRFPDNVKVIGTEKVDGTNGRIIIMPDKTYLIGSREELIYAQGDFIENPVSEIVPTLKPIAERIVGRPDLFPADDIYIFFLEAFGGSGITPASKTYTTTKTAAARMFDVAFIPSPDQPNGNWGWHTVLDMTRDKISSWREHGGQFYSNESVLKCWADLIGVSLTPRLEITPPPLSVEETYEWLKKAITKSLVVLDDKAQGKPEGIVVRTETREYIAKIRFEDYERTMRTRAKLKEMLEG